MVATAAPCWLEAASKGFLWQVMRWRSDPVRFFATKVTCAILAVAARTQRSQLAGRPLLIGQPIRSQTPIAKATRSQAAIHARSAEHLAVAHGEHTELDHLAASRPESGCKPEG